MTTLELSEGCHYSANNAESLWSSAIAFMISE
jgi:hypothetical protein